MFVRLGQGWEQTDLAGAAWVGLTAGPGAAGAPVFPPGVPGASWDLQESETWLNSSLASPGWLSSAGSVGREQPWLQPSERKQRQISLLFHCSGPQTFLYFIRSGRCFLTPVRCSPGTEVSNTLFCSSAVGQQFPSQLTEDGETWKS